MKYPSPFVIRVQKHLEQSGSQTVKLSKSYQNNFNFLLRIYDINYHVFTMSGLKISEKSLLVCVCVCVAGGRNFYVGGGGGVILLAGGARSFGVKIKTA